MPLFLSDKEYARCFHDASLISQKADAYIRGLYTLLDSQKAQSIDKDVEIERLSLEVSELQKSNTQLLQLIEHKDLEINEKNSSIKGYLYKFVALIDMPSSKEQIDEEASVKIQFDPEVIQIVQNMVQFNGLPDEDPYAHIANFLEICDFFEFCGTFKINDAIRLRLFSFSLRDKAKLWLRSLPVGSVTTWDTMAEKFVSKYFPRSKTKKLRKDIYSFLQDDEETLYETWERFKDLLRRCPDHKIPLWSQVEIFHNGLFVETSRELNLAAGGSLISKTPEAAFDLIEKTAMSNYQWEPIRDKPSTQDVHEVDAITSLTATIEALNRKIEQMQVNKLQVSCELCGGLHPSGDCQQGNIFASLEQVDYLENQVRPQINPHNNTYNLTRRSYSNSSSQDSSINQLPTGFQLFPPYQLEPRQNQQHQYY